MEDISNKITQLSQDLKAFQIQLQWNKIQCSNPGDQERIMDHLLKAGLGNDLKKAVDLLSHFLWCYIESAAANANAEVDYTQQSWRLGQITETLRLLHHSACPLKDSLAFLEQTAMTVTRHVEAERLQERLPLEQTA
jgi:hypothetical protein